jgi:hypothetical protein
VTPLQLLSVLQSVFINFQGAVPLKLLKTYLFVFFPVSCELLVVMSWFQQRNWSEVAKEQPLPILDSLLPISLARFS